MKFSNIKKFYQTGFSGKKDKNDERRQTFASRVKKREDYRNPKTYKNRKIVIAKKF
jgi:hypothetical protein